MCGQGSSSGRTAEGTPGAGMGAIHRSVSTARHDALIAAASAWALADERVRALLLKGSLARGKGDERSDVDLVIVTLPGRLGELWADRRAIAARLDHWLGGFDEVAWQAPSTFIGFYDGPIKVDFFFQEGEPHADPWLRDGFVALVDPDGLADALPARLADERGSPDLSDFDAHAWDWLWWMDVKLTRGGQAWLVHIELVKFVETMLLTGHNALSPEPWRGASEVEQRLPAEVQAELRAALPAAPEPEELRRAFDVALQQYLRLRQQLATERRMPLAQDLAGQVLDRIGPG
jgi:predicted nucleotidyltransferase